MRLAGMDSPLPLLLSTLAISLTICYVFFRADKGRRRAPLPPGPRGWPVLGNLPQLGGKTHQTLHEMTKVYGPVLRLRFGSNVVVVAGSAAVAEQFLRTHDAKFSSRPPNSGGEHMAYNYQDVVFAPYGPRWRAMRKVCAVNLFSARALDDLRGFREREAALMVRSLADAARGGAVVAVGKVANVCTTNALSRAAVGLRVFAVGSELGAKDFKEIVLEVMEVGGVLNVGDFVPALRWLDPQGVVARLKKLHRRFDDMMNGIIAERRSGAKTAGAEQGKEDLLELLLSMVQEHKSLTGGEEDKITDTDVKALVLVILARDPALWPDPLEYRPARFLPGGSHESVDLKGGDFGFIPFGAGRRICAGLSWGVRMVTMTTATLVHSFDWELPAGQTPDKLNMEEAFSLLLQRAVPLMAHPVPRLLPSAYEIA